MSIQYTITRSLVGALLIAGIACQSSETNHSSDRKDGFTPVLKTKQDSLLKEVMDGHDIGMAKMSKITRYQRLVQQSVDSLSRLPGKKIDKAYQQALIDLQEDLNYAEYSMSTWMSDFKHDSAANDTNRRIQYLESEKIKVTKVKESILSSLQRADSLFLKK